MPEQTETKTRERGDDQLVIEHADTKGRGTCTRSAFNRVWQHKGWTVVDEDGAKGVLADAGNAPDLDVEASRSKDKGDDQGESEPQNRTGPRTQQTTRSTDA